MMKKYSTDLREKAIKLVVEEKKKQVEIAKLLWIDKSTLFRWVKRYRETGSISAKNPKKMGRKHKISTNKLEEFRSFVDKSKDMSLKELAKKWGGISYTTAYRTMKRINYSYKKNHFYTEKGTKKNVIASKKSF